MPGHDPVTNTYILGAAETDFTLLETDGNATVIGSGLANILIGNNSRNSIEGGGGSDTLRGEGGADTLFGGADQDYLDGGEGQDELRGGNGDDIYVVDDALDTVIELVGQGTDQVNTSVSLTLGANIENLRLFGGGIDGVGNALGNEIMGSTGRNLLRGLAGNDTLDGGGGIDTLKGGMGNDVYLLRDTDDIIEELTDEGTDRIDTYFGLTLSLPALAAIENVTLLGQDDFDLTGNALENTINGNTGDNVLEGLDGNDTLDGGGGLDTLRGGDGDDVYNVDGNDDVLEEAADEGVDEVRSSDTFSLAVAGREHIEILRLKGIGDFDGIGNDRDNEIHGNGNVNVLHGGDGDDTIFGGGGADTLHGDANDDTLNGGQGGDRMEGGMGDDTYYVDDAGDDIFEAAGAGNDTVVSSRSFTLVGTQLENITLTAAGTATGNDVANVLNGSTGVDRLVGGEGDDLYIVDTALDVVVEQAGVNTGYDRVRASGTYTLSDNVEYLQLMGTNSINGTGNGLANELIGNDGNNILEGRDGADIIRGGGGSDQLNGGADADELAGGGGNDTYMIDAEDTLMEVANEGTDTVIASFSHALLAEFENLTLTGAAAIDGTGNTHNNFIQGNAGANVLKGEAGDDSLMGGAGADRLDGGTGSDLYWVDNAGDVVSDAGAGFDRVLASVDYILGANLEYLAFEGTTGFKGGGNDLDNDIFGNVGNNTLDGGSGRDKIDGGEGNDSVLGGAGDDTINDWRGNDVIDGGLGNDDLRGGVGNDVYHVDAGDTVTELVGQGYDRIIASQSFSLSAISEVEVLQAMAGKTAINLTGGGGANRITGNLGANVLTGGAGDDTLAGGAGKDVLVGGDGKDFFVFDAKPDPKTNVDKITGYLPKEDTILLDNAVFRGLGKKGTPEKPQPLSKKAFWIGTSAHDADDRIIFNKNTGALFYDDDGIGAHAAIKIITLSKKLKMMTHKEFMII